MFLAAIATVTVAVSSLVAYLVTILRCNRDDIPEVVRAWFGKPPRPPELPQPPESQALP